MHLVFLQQVMYLYNHHHKHLHSTYNSALELNVLHDLMM